MKKLLVVAPADEPRLKHLEALRPHYQIKISTTEESTDAEAVLSWAGGKALAALIEKSPSIKWIHSSSAGVEGILSPQLVESEITLTNAAGVFAESLGEFAITGILYFAKDLPRMLQSKREKKWDQFEVDVLPGKRLGVIGFGSIGKAIAKRGKVLGLEVTAFRSNPQGEEEGISVLPTADLDKELPSFDYLALSLPLTPETNNLLSSERLALLKKECVIVNVGRGKTIDEVALIEALKSGRLKGACLDVFAAEPLPETSPLWELDNVLLSPHTADRTSTWLDDSMKFFVSNALRFAKGEPLNNIVGKKRGY